MLRSTSSTRWRSPSRRPRTRDRHRPQPLRPGLHRRGARRDRTSAPRPDPGVPQRDRARRPTRRAGGAPTRPDRRRRCGGRGPPRQRPDGAPGPLLALVARGRSNRDTGAILGISERTVQKHLEHCYRVLELPGRSATAKMAWGLLAAGGGGVVEEPARRGLGGRPGAAG